MNGAYAAAALLAKEVKEYLLIWNTMNIHPSVGVDNKTMKRNGLNQTR